jgi:hypothetical protein
MIATDGMEAVDAMDAAIKVPTSKGAGVFFFLSLSFVSHVVSGFSSVPKFDFNMLKSPNISTSSDDSRYLSYSSFFFFFFCFLSSLFFSSSLSPHCGLFFSILLTDCYRNPNLSISIPVHFLQRKHQLQGRVLSDAEAAFHLKDIFKLAYSVTTFNEGVERWLGEWF